MKIWKSLDRYVVTAMLYILGWSIAFYVAWIIKGEEPSVLEGCILTPGAVELVCAAWIKNGKGARDERNSIQNNRACGAAGSACDCVGADSTDEEDNQEPAG